eukprot:XP_011666385.1 PREDICTED: uncharacterized protein DDB_G0283697 isoform X2 [Strongylocentrotus purpuratus]
MAAFPALYNIYKGEVASIQSYGAFVKLDGYKKNGLVHKSQISRTKRVEDVSEVLSVGDIVWSKVISLGEDEEMKISLSMKVVNQDNGQDLDPNMVQTKQEEQRRKKGSYVPKPKIELGAVLNTTCRKCGTVGHLSKDCFYTPGEKTYDLIPDIDVSMLSHKQDMTQSKEKGHKQKKKKKKIKRVSSTDDSDSDDQRGRRGREEKAKKKKHKKKFSSSASESLDEESSAEERRKRKRKKDRKKKKRERRDTPSSDSDSDDSYENSKKSKKRSRSKVEREKSQDRRMKDSSKEKRESDREKRRHQHGSSDDDTPHHRSREDRKHESRTHVIGRRNSEKERTFDRQKERSSRDEYRHPKAGKESSDRRKDNGMEDSRKKKRRDSDKRRRSSSEESDVNEKRHQRTDHNDSLIERRDYDRQKRRSEKEEVENDRDDGYHKHHSRKERDGERSDRKNVRMKDSRKESSCDR